MMPTIISDSHHKFWDNFNDYGVPTFVETEQNLFAKNSEGYLIPIKVLIKIHYDKTFGHSFVGFINKISQIAPF